LHRQTKRQYENGKMNEIQESKENNNIRSFYKIINEGRKPFKPKINICKDEKNKILIQKPQILEQWNKHVIKHFNCNSDQEELEEA